MKFPSIVVVSALVMAGCSSVSVTNQWKDPAWSGPPASHVLVVGVARSETMRRIFEDTFSQQLRAAGVEATASYTQIAASDSAGGQIEIMATNSSDDAILVTRVQRVQQKIDVMPAMGPGYGSFRGWYGGAWAGTPQVSQYDVVTLETSIWDARTGKVVWTVTTQGVGTHDIPKATTNLAQTLIPKLKSDGILR